jgi:hypothetical protein
MHYIKRKRERRAPDDARAKKRGPRVTFMSLAAAAAFLAVIKAKNPGAELKPMIVMFSGVIAACVIMNVISARAGKDD